MRPDLARLPGTQPFTTEDPHSSASGVYALPALTDSDITTSVNAGFLRDTPRDVAFGVLWHAAQSVQQVVFRQGSVTEQGSGFFDEAPVSR